MALAAVLTGAVRKGLPHRGTHRASRIPLFLGGGILFTAMVLAVMVLGVMAPLANLGS